MIERTAQLACEQAKNGSIASIVRSQIAAQNLRVSKHVLYHGSAKSKRRTAHALEDKMFGLIARYMAFLFLVS
jgi:hypothetical protein